MSRTCCSLLGRHGTSPAARVALLPRCRERRQYPRGNSDTPVSRPSLLSTGVYLPGDTAVLSRNDGKTLLSGLARDLGRPPGSLARSIPSRHHRQTWGTCPSPSPSNSPVPASISKRDRCALAYVLRDTPSCGDTPLRQTHASVGDVCSEHQVCASPQERVPPAIRELSPTSVSYAAVVTRPLPGCKLSVRPGFAKRGGTRPPHPLPPGKLYLRHTHPPVSPQAATFATWVTARYGGRTTLYPLVPRRPAGPPPAVYESAGPARPRSPFRVGPCPGTLWVPLGPGFTSPTDEMRPQSPRTLPFDRSRRPTLTGSAHRRPRSRDRSRRRAPNAR